MDALNILTWKDWGIYICSAGSSRPIHIIDLEKKKKEKWYNGLTFIIYRYIMYLENDSTNYKIIQLFYFCCFASHVIFPGFTSRINSNMHSYFVIYICEFECQKKKKYVQPFSSRRIIVNFSSYPFLDPIQSNLFWKLWNMVAWVPLIIAERK